MVVGMDEAEDLPLEGSQSKPICGAPGTKVRLEADTVRDASLGTSHHTCSTAFYGEFVAFVVS